MGCNASVTSQGASACNDAGDPSASSGETVQPTREERKTAETAETQASSSAADAEMIEESRFLEPAPKSLPTGAASSFARLFREYGAQGVNADMTSRPVSRPHYDPLMDEIFAVKSGEELSRQPLVSPKYVMRAAEILAVDLLEESFLVPVLKTLLPSLSNAFNQGRLEEEVPVALAALAKERQAQRQAEAQAPEKEQTAKELAKGCEECGEEPVDYCPACEGFFCRACFQRIHAKGRRAEHPRLDISMAGFKMKADDDMMQNQVVNVHWHPFHDDRGIRYYYNFEMHRSVRQLSKKELSWRPAPPLPERQPSK